MPRGRLVLLALLTLGGAACVQPLRLAHDDSPVVLATHRLAAPNPALPGPYPVRRLFYGSGTDRRRPEYRDSVTVRTATVDGSKLVSAPPNIANPRRKYWGFGFDELPVNGRVWYPDGPGPFPLVLIVHGNHNMRDFSDPGYGYLGELFASRGFITVSVDENFLNGNLRSENDARGWMLLRHLRAWRHFNDSAGGPFHGKVDLGRVTLMGHSRGGEAVAIAALFNRLSHYPDDATVGFDFGFGIRSIVAIAPIDGQYEPANRPTPLADVSYLVIHGSHDGDVSAFSGLRQYERIRYPLGGPWFKAAVWMYRANHGQWNTVWGNKDGGPRSARWLDLRGLIPQADQREFAKVYLSAFLEATLHDRREYLPLFADHRVIGGWLPQTMYVTRFQDAGFRPLADFSEDVDVTTGTAPGVRLQGDSLAAWREAVIPLRWQNSTVGHNAVWLGWNNRIEGDDTTRMGKPASYTVRLPEMLPRAWAVSQGTTVILSLAPTSDTPSPRKPPADSTRADTTKKQETPRPPPPPPRPTKEARDTTPFDFSVELVDRHGVAARLSLSRFGPIRRPIEMTVYRRSGRDKQRFASLSELVLQTFVMPVADFIEAEPRLDPTALAEVRLVFDRTPAGTVVLTDLGLSNLDPAFVLRETAPVGAR
jgi:hypothetical protein